MRDASFFRVSKLYELILCVFVLQSAGCTESSEITPSTLLPFEYKVTLKSLSSDCIETDRPLENAELSGKLEVGEVQDLAVIELNVAQFDWQLRGSICLEAGERTQKQPNALCLRMRSSRLLKVIERAEQYRSSSDERLLCEQIVSSPPLAMSNDSADRIELTDLEWRDRLERCCEDGVADRDLLRLEIDEAKTISGQIDVKYELQVRSQTISEMPLTNEEIIGAVADCGPPLNEPSAQLSCTDRFSLTARAE